MKFFGLDKGEKSEYKQRIRTKAIWEQNYFKAASSNSTWMRTASSFAKKPRVNVSLFASHPMNEASEKQKQVSRRDSNGKLQDVSEV